MTPSGGGPFGHIDAINSAAEADINSAKVRIVVRCIVLIVSANKSIPTAEFQANYRAKTALHCEFRLVWTCLITSDLIPAL